MKRQQGKGKKLKGKSVVDFFKSDHHPFTLYPLPFRLPRCLLPVAVVLLFITSPGIGATNPPPQAASGLYIEGVNLYKAGRYSEAMDAFEKALTRHEHEKEAQEYMDRIRKETVERIRNTALTGVSKANWQTKYFYLHEIGGRVRVGISDQELFDPGSLNFRQGAVDALDQLAHTLQKSDNTNVEVELINEITQDTARDPEILSQQLAAVFSFLSHASRNALPK